MVLSSSVFLFAVATRSTINSHLPGHLLIVLSLAGFFVAVAGGLLSYFVNPIICYVGRISYSCYLVHFAMIGAAVKLLGAHRVLGSAPLDQGSSLANMWLFAKLTLLSLVFTIPVAAFARRFVERWGINTGKRVITLLTARASGFFFASRRKTTSVIEIP